MYEMSTLFCETNSRYDVLEDPLPEGRAHPVCDRRCARQQNTAPLTGATLPAWQRWLSILGMSRHIAALGASCFKRRPFLDLNRASSRLLVVD